MNPFTRVRQLLAEAIANRVCPGAVAEIGTQEGPLTRIVVGALTYDGGATPVREDTWYDLASLTKVLAGASLVLDLIEREQLKLDAPAARWLRHWRRDERAGITVRDLLSHSAGLSAHRPLYLQAMGRHALEPRLCRVPLAYTPRTAAIYSDLGFIALGWIVEDVTGRSLPTVFDAWCRSAIGIDTAMRFGPIRDRTTFDVAPTERDPWRGRLLTGEVHDENAAALGGASLHAGLFGTADAVGRIARWWMTRLTDAADPQGPSNPRTFATRTAVMRSSRALAWDTMLPTSSCGTRLSPRAIGHTGFSGTSLWIDPDSGHYFVLLTNRVHPTRHGHGIRALRHAFHDRAVEDLGR